MAVRNIVIFLGKMFPSMQKSKTPLQNSLSIFSQFSFLNIDQELRYNALSATVSQRQAQAETIREEPRPEYQLENHSGISLGLFTPSPTDYDTEEAIQANRLKKKKKKPKRKRGFSL